MVVVFTEVLAFAFTVLVVVVEEVVAAVVFVVLVLAVVAIVLIVSSIVGSQRDVLLDQGIALVIACVLLHAGGFLLGWLIPRVLGEAAPTCRTISLEVGMQNSGLAVVLARTGFSNPLTALPGAISAVVHCIIGSALAGLWRRRDQMPTRP